MSLKYAQSSRLGRAGAKLLHINGGGYSHHRMGQLASLVPPNSVMVVNTAATLPASLPGKVGPVEVELRLVRNPDWSQLRHWQVLLYQGGSWRMRTEDRLDPDFIEPNDVIEFGGMTAQVTSVLHPSKRFLQVRFDGTEEEIWQGIYSDGRPIQYSHLSHDLQLWDVQTIFASRPVAVEPPSAAFQLSWKIVNQLIEQGVNVVGITHATSISSTGNDDLDRNLPFDETYWIGEGEAEILNSAIAEGREVTAVGTSVVRALEDNLARHGRFEPGSFDTSLVVDPDHTRLAVDNLLTGMHLTEETHMKLLHNFVGASLLDAAYQSAAEAGYLWHEYGDVNLIRSPIR